jgi:hypothetical protein
MSGSNAWAEFANLYRVTRAAAIDHDRAKAELKALVARTSKLMAPDFDRLARSPWPEASLASSAEASHAAIQ